MVYPQAHREPVVDERFGHAIADPYRWLEDPASPATAAWLAAQDDLWRATATTFPQHVYARVAELSGTGLVTAPTWRGARRFFLRQRPDQDHPVLYAADPAGTERVLVDPVALDRAGETTLDVWQPDLDGRLLAYQLSQQGTERAALYVLDVDTGRVVDGPLDRCRYSPVAWLPGGEAFYYVRTAPDSAARHVYLHKVGTPGDNDVLVFGADRGRDTAYGLGVSADGRWLTVAATRGSLPGNDIWLADLAGCPAERPDLLAVQDGVAARTTANVGPDGRLYVVTDRDAPRGRLCVGDPARPDDWRTLIPEDDTSVLRDVAVLDDVLLVGRTRHAVGEIGVHDPVTGDRVGTVPLPGFGSVGTISARGHEAWFSYSDSVTPRAVHRYDARTGHTSPWAAAPGVAAIPVIESHQIVCTSADGTPVRVVVFARPDTPGPRPTILYGYGGFGLSLTPTYSSYLLAWVEAGGVFATAQLRGGGEEGDAWHRAGMRERKQNVFDDFIAVAAHLIADGWTTREQLGICGESNGGLLVGAAITQRPDLFAAAVCSAPVLDMARYERFGGAGWRQEYGSADDPQQLGWLLGYSPYHHVRHGVDYPAVLFTSFGGDSRVDPLHARKMCAALQWAGGDRPILLRHEDGVGHARSATSRAVALAADMLAFLAAHTGLNWTSS